MFGIRGLEWILLLVVVLLLFGPAKIPELARSVGKAITEFKNGLKGTGGEDRNPDGKGEPKNGNIPGQ